MLNWLLIFVPVAIAMEFLMPNSHTLIFIASCLAIIPLASLLITLGRNGVGALSIRFLTAPAAPVGEDGGIAHAIVGSLCLLAVASAVAIPIGLTNGIYLSRRTPGRLAPLTRLLLEVMSGIPAIIVGTATSAPYEARRFTISLSSTVMSDRLTDIAVVSISRRLSIV